MEDMTTDPMSSDRSQNKVSPVVLESLKDIVRDLASTIQREIEDERTHNTRHEMHCHSPDTHHHRIGLTPLLHRHTVSSGSIIDKIHSHTLPINVKILEKHRTYNVYQLEVIKQTDPVSCGYHSFHNAYVTLKASLAKDQELAVHYLSKLRSPTSLAFRRNRLKHLLESKILTEGQQGYPWTLKDLGLGVMERPYMTHVVHYSEEATILGGPKSFVCLPDFSIGSLCNGAMSPDSVRNLQHIFDKFQTCENYSHGFLVGSVNHWIALVGNKHKVPGESRSEIELLLLDSRNYAVLNATEEELAKIVQDHYDRLDKRGVVVDHRQFRQKMYLLSIKDTQCAVNLIYECMTGLKNFQGFYIGLSVQGMLQSFATNVPSTTTKEDYNALVYNWLCNFYPPKHLEEMLDRFNRIGISYMYEADQRKLLEWAALLQSRIDSKQAEKRSLARLVGCLNDIQSLLKRDCKL